MMKTCRENPEDRDNDEDMPGEPTGRDNDEGMSGESEDRDNDHAGGIVS